MESEETKKGTWGGRRAGSGRKKVSRLTHKCTFKLSEEVVGLLNLADNKAEVVDIAIRRYFSR